MMQAESSSDISPHGVGLLGQGDESRHVGSEAAMLTGRGHLACLIHHPSSPTSHLSAPLDLGRF